MAQPVSVGTRGTPLPSGLALFISENHAERRPQFPPPSRNCFLLEPPQFRGRCFIKIAFGHQWIPGCLAFDVAANIPPIFAQQGIEFILRVTLEKYEELFLLLDKCVHACFCRARQHFVSAICQLFFGHTIPTRMRQLELHRSSRCQGMIGHVGTLEDAENLVLSFYSSNAVHVQDRSMSCQARQNSRMAILLCP